jgi:hypothetical protein
MAMQGSEGASVRTGRVPKQVTLPQSLPESSARHPDTEEVTGSIPVPPTQVRAGLWLSQVRRCAPLGAV